jgi:hypothetical protein
MPTARQVPQEFFRLQPEMESRTPTVDPRGLADAGPIYVRDADE